MRRQTISFAAVAVATLSAVQLSAGTIQLPVDQLAAIYPAPNDPLIEHGARLLMEFDLPDSLNSKRIIYAEVWAPFPVENLRDTTLSFDLFSLATSWDENEVTWTFPWQNPGGDIDSLSVFRRYFAVGSADTLNLDLTEVTREWVAASRPNNGFLVATNFLNRRGLRFNLNPILPQIRSRLSLRIIFDDGPPSY